MRPCWGPRHDPAVGPNPPTFRVFCARVLAPFLLEQPPARACDRCWVEDSNRYSQRNEVMNSELKLSNQIRGALVAAIAFGAAVLPASQAFAVSAQVRYACAGDYLA